MSTTATAPKTATAKNIKCPAYCDPTLCSVDAEGNVAHYSATQKFEGRIYDLTAQWSLCSWQRRSRVLLNIQTEDITTRELRVLIKDLEDLASKMDTLNY